jgi:hypothetical protein
MKTRKHFARRAEQCLQTAVTFHNHEARDTLLHMAHVWFAWRTTTMISSSRQQSNNPGQ